MRRIDRPRSLPRKSLPEPPSLGIIALNRMAFGPRPGDLGAFTTLGSTPDERLAAFVDQQLNPGGIDDSNVESRLTAAGLVTLNKSRAQLWAQHGPGAPWQERYRPYWETEIATFIRAVYSKRQLVQVLADFWHNHFNTRASESVTASMFVHFDRTVIRNNLLGNFRAMLEDVAQSTGMLYYLDNYTSTNAGPNENFAREIFELHALGAENYLGVQQQNQVPVDGDGRPIGYVDADVYEATRCFTGWTYSNDTGLFEYRDDWHDRFQKTVLGNFLPADGPPQSDGLTVLDALAEHPGTARHIARKLCQRFISDNPPQEIIDEAAAVFSNNLTAPDQLKRVVRKILLSDSFKTTWGEKIKRPFEIASSALRATAANIPFTFDDDETNTFFYYYDQTGQPLFVWPAPDGYPDTIEDWESPSPRVLTWRFCNFLIGWDDDNDNFFVNVLGQTPAGKKTANELADFWINRILGRPMPDAERAEIVELMAQGHNPDYDLPVATDEDTRDRIRSMVGTILMSPSFLWR